LFKLPDGSKLGPDGSWVSNEKLATLSKIERRGFARMVPEFVIELKSPTGSYSKLQLKMQDWIRNGVELGWLIDPDRQTVLIYRNHRAAPELHERSAGILLAADGSVKGFVLDLVRRRARTEEGIQNQIFPA
jgi:Uma2 family endonuclease